VSVICRGLRLLSRTLMRSPVVKSQTYPVSGCLRFSPPCCCWHRWPSAACPDVISPCGCTHVAAPHPYGGALAVCTTMAESRTGVLCDLETYGCPRTVLCQRRETREPCPSSGQARVRSRTHQPLTSVAGSAGAGVGVSSTVWLRDHDRYAHGRATTPCLTHGRALMNRLIPRRSREACSAPTPRPDA
jgi:hypothetical protein